MQLPAAAVRVLGAADATAATRALIAQTLLRADGSLLAPPPPLLAPGEQADPAGVRNADGRHETADAKAQDDAAAAERAKAKKDPAAAVAAYVASLPKRGAVLAGGASKARAVKAVGPGTFDSGLELHHGFVTLGDARSEAWLWLKSGVSKDPAATVLDVKGSGVLALPAATVVALAAAAAESKLGAVGWSVHRALVVPADVTGSMTPAGRIALTLTLRVPLVAAAAAANPPSFARDAVDVVLYLSGSLQDGARRVFVAQTGLNQAGVAAVAAAVEQAAGDKTQQKAGVKSSSATAPITPAFKAAAATLAGAATGDLKTAVGSAVLEVVELPGEVAAYAFSRALLAAFWGAEARASGGHGPSAGPPPASAVGDYWLTRLARLAVRSAGLLAATLIEGPRVGYEEEELRPLFRSRLLESGPVLGSASALSALPFVDVTGFGLQWDESLGQAAAALARLSPAPVQAGAAVGAEPPALHLSATAVPALGPSQPAAQSVGDTDRWLHDVVNAGTESAETVGSKILAWLQVRAFGGVAPCVAEAE